MAAAQGLAPMLDLRSRQACLVAAAICVLPLALLLPVSIGAALAAFLALAALTQRRDRPLGAWIKLPIVLAAVALVLREYGIGGGGDIGRDTGCALLACGVVLKLLETRSLRDARALVSFGLFAIMAAFLQDRGPLTLVLATAASLVAIGALARLAEVETAVEGAPGDPVSARLRGAARLAAVSLPLALVAFVLFPRLASPLWGLPQNSQEARTGLSDEMAPGDIANLYVDDTPVLRVRFEDAVPPVAERYFRGPVLSLFDGRRWTRSGWTSSLEAAPLEALGPEIRYEVEQEPTERRFLFPLDLPLSAPAGGRLGLERSVMSGRPLQSISRTAFRSTTRYRLEPELRRTLRELMTQLPANYNPRTRALAAQWRAEGLDDTALIRRLLERFNAGFTYTLNPQLLGRDSVDDFLFDTRQGYCEHFASAFVFFLRAADIPARVVTGYQGGYINPLGGYLVIRQSDAHAWAEAWLAGEGWVRIDPTSAVAPQRIERGADVMGREREVAYSWGRPLFDAADFLRRGWNDFVLGFDAARQSRILRPLGIEQAGWRELGLALLAAGAIAMLATLALVLRRPPDGSDAVGRAWLRFVRRLARHGVVKEAYEGPLDFAARAGARLPASADALATLSMRYARRRYAADRVDSDADRRLVEDLMNFRPIPEPPP